MAYIGKQPVVGNFVKLDAITTSATATYNLLNGGVAYFPQTANNCIVSLNGVIQSPTSAYTISGSTIVFSDALTASDSIDFILVLGDVLAIGTPSDGTVTSAKLASGTAGLISWQSVQTTGFTASAGRGYPCNTTSAAFTVTLPASPSIGDTIILLDYAGTFDTNLITLSPNGNKINGSTDTKVLSTEREAVTITYVDSTQGWLASSGVNEGTFALAPTPISIDFLVVAGGAAGGTGGGSEPAGGGGAGGYRTSTQTVFTGTTITVTVGDGGASGNPNNVIGNSGSNSSISGSGLTTITSAGGGGGAGGAATVGASGGSGGGAAGITTIYAGGSGNTPSTSPSQGNNGGSGTPGTDWAGGGGGGAGAVGQNGSVRGSQYGGLGGNGSASSITGSSVTYAGGGGGGSWSGGDNAAGGTGGGGTGGRQSGTATGTNGTANLGGGGGGAVATATAGAGGKGVVILSMPDANYSGTTTGSPTVATGVSGKTVLTFNGSGSYTA
jgi:hypothetical protein